MKIGDWVIPQNRLATSLHDIKKIYEQFKSDETSNDLIAHTLNQAPRGGAFLQKMADLRAYGLIEGRGGKIRVTELGKQATYGHSQERATALEKIIKNIPLWGILFDKYGTSIKEENFWIDLVQITGAERLDAQKQANFIRNAYIMDVKNILPVEKPAEPIKTDSEPGAHDRRHDMEFTTKDAVVYIKYPSIGIVDLDLNDETNLTIAETILKTIRIKLQKERQLQDTAPQEQDNFDS